MYLYTNIFYDTRERESVCVVVCFPSHFNFALANISLLGFFFSRAPYFIFPLIEWKFQLFICLILLIDTHTQLVLDNFCTKTNKCTGGRPSKQASAVLLQSPICHVQWASSLFQCHHQHSHMFDYYKFKWRNFTHFTQCELAVFAAGLSRRTNIWFTKWVRNETAQKKIYTTKRRMHNNSSGNRRKNLYNNQNELHKTLQFHTNNFQWMIWMFFFFYGKTAHIVVCAEKLRAKTTTEQRTSVSNVTDCFFCSFDLFHILLPLLLLLVLLLHTSV